MLTFRLLHVIMKQHMHDFCHLSQDQRFFPVKSKPTMSYVINIKGRSQPLPFQASARSPEARASWPPTSCTDAGLRGAGLSTTQSCKVSLIYRWIREQITAAETSHQQRFFIRRSFAEAMAAVCL